MEIDYEEPDLFIRKKDDASQTNMILGRSRTGKTFFLVSELNKIVGMKRGGKGPTRNRPMYDKIILFTESLDAAPLKGLDPTLDIKIINGFRPTIVRLLKKIQDNTNCMFRFLILLDDVITGIRGGIFPKMILTFRNSHIATCVLLQNIKMVTPATRQSCHQIYITGLRDDDYEYVMRSFLSSHARELLGGKKTLYQLGHEFRKLAGSDIVHFDNIMDKLSFIHREFGGLEENK